MACASRDRAAAVTQTRPERLRLSQRPESCRHAASPIATAVPTYKSSDGLFELIVREDPNDEDDQINGPGHGKHFVLRDLKTATETEFSKIPGSLNMIAPSMS